MTLNLKILWRSPYFLTVAILSFGALIRIVQYESNRSLWGDEAKLALNIVSRSYGEFFQPLAYDQAAPIGFLFVEKAAVQLLGNSEYALRAFPLVASLVSLLLFYQLSKYYLDKNGVILANALFASNQYLVYYGSEIKQYSTDVAIALFVFLHLVVFRPEKLTLKWAIYGGMVGAIAIWFSHPVVFILTGVEGVRLILLSVNHQNLKLSEWAYQGITYCFWLGSFVWVYAVALTDIRNNQFLPFTWSNEFPEHPLDLLWLLEAFRSFFYKPLAFPPVISEFAILLFIAGSIWLFRHHRSQLWYLLAPTGLTLIAGYLGQYPFDNRLVLFLLPFFLILFVLGLTQCLKLNRVRTTPLKYVILLAIMAFPLVEGALFLFNPYAYENIKPVMQYVQEHRQPGDVVYVHQKSRFQFRYYAERFGFDLGEYQFGVDLDDTLTTTITADVEQDEYQEDIDSLLGEPRVWFIFSDSRLRDETELFLSHLEDVGRKIDTFTSDEPTSFVHLYDLAR